MGIKIDDDVPMPDDASERLVYPWPDVRPGQSFFAPGRTAAAMSTAAGNWAKRNQPTWRFKCKTRTEGGVKGARVWRAE